MQATTHKPPSPHLDPAKRRPQGLDACRRATQTKPSTRYLLNLCLVLITLCGVGQKGVFHRLPRRQIGEKGLDLDKYGYAQRSRHIAMCNIEASRREGVNARFGPSICVIIRVSSLLLFFKPQLALQSVFLKPEVCCSFRGERGI
jgi:hypothetical protein